MPQRNPLCSAMEQSEHNPPPSYRQVDSNTETALEGSTCCVSVQRNGDPASSSPENGSSNGEGKRGGKNRRRRKRTANPETHPAVVEVKDQEEAEPIQMVSQLDSSTYLLCLQAECASVWFERSVYEQAESLYQCWLTRTAGRTTHPPPEALPAPENQLSPPSVSSSRPATGQGEQPPSQQPATPNSLPLIPSPPTSPTTPDEGYQSLAPTPATPTLQAASTSHQPINGLPRVPVELLRDVWLEKPLYDCAEAAFYQNLYGNHPGTSHSRVNSPSTIRSTDHPQSLVEEEEEEEQEEDNDEEKEEVLVSLEKTVVAQGKAESFHALHPIQEEEEPAEVMEEEALSVDGVGYFLHPDSERVWLERWHYDAAESRFHSHRGGVISVSERAQSLSSDSRAPSSGDCTSPLRDNTMTAVEYLAQEKIWFDKPRYDEAERRFYEGINGPSHPAQSLQTFQDVGANSILQDIARARENIQKSLAGLKSSLLSSGGSGEPLLNHSYLVHFVDESHHISCIVCQNVGCGAGDQGEFVTRIRNLELENRSLHKLVEDFRLALSKLECRVAVLEKSPSIPSDPAAPCTNGTTPVQQQKNCAPMKIEEDDDDFDLFGSDVEEDEEAERLKEERLKEYAERKAKKPALIAKSSILLDVKPWDDETDMAKLEECVRSVQADGLLWGQSKLVPVGYGIRKLQIACVVEDDKVGTDMLEEEITKFEDYVQSVDVAAFNKI